jgi:outer membrane receptor protein involved in Fe transport
MSLNRVLSLMPVLGLIAFPLTSDDSTGSALEIEEIVVTARKREESLLDIAESITAISGSDIETQNIKTLDDIGFLVPNLNLSMRADGFPNVSIRGLGSFGNTQGVGFYIDDVQLFSDASSRFGDLER